MSASREQRQRRVILWRTRIGGFAVELEPLHILDVERARRGSVEHGAGFQDRGLALDEDQRPGDDGGEAVEPPSFEVTFKPRSDLYSKGNDAALLLRDLRRLGDMSINCDMSSLPPLDQMDPEAAYFGWKIWIKTEKGEEGIKEYWTEKNTISLDGVPTGI